MKVYMLCPRCEQRSIDPEKAGLARRQLRTRLCDTCCLDEAIRDILGVDYVPAADWPVEPIFGAAVRAAYHGEVPHPVAPGQLSLGGIEQYQAEDR